MVRLLFLLLLQLSDFVVMCAAVCVCVCVQVHSNGIFYFLKATLSYQAGNCNVF